MGLGLCPVGGGTAGDMSVTFRFVLSCASQASSPRKPVLQLPQSQGGEEH